ncbi:YagK/YfjJ domain-containing protein [Pseudomonas umsongensis]|uniref:YagK/YfjJ domain-containing protein n=1 Tax=Pseudomonas umsongensis TaxID=198618 RepID=UPI0015A581A1|nr:inovirus-type Gp2 protein [Pseudomonas umsongensis]
MEGIDLIQSKSINNHHPTCGVLQGMKGCVSVSNDEREIALLSKCRIELGNGEIQGELDIGFVSELKLASIWVQKLIRTEGEAFTLRDVSRHGDPGLKRNYPGAILFKLLKMNVSQDERLRSLYTFEPYIALMVKQIEAFGLTYNLLRTVHRESEDNAGLVQKLNSCVDSIRLEARSKAFQGKLKNYQRSSNKNYKELTEYVDALFERYSRLLVLRVDLGYREQHSKTTQAEAKQNREHLFRNTRSNKLFGDMVGYIWKLEHGPDKGFHYHMIFFFDGSKVREDGTLVKRIGQYWLDVITKGRGVYYNCNADKSRYKSCGIGMVDHRDSSMRDTLNSLAVPYLTKTDLYMKLQTTGRGMGKMERPRQKDPRGRPRVVRSDSARAA